MQQPSPPVGPPKRNLSETVWTKLDRKATAIAEFTLRQYRKKRSTLTVGAVGALLVVIVLLFYIDAMSEGIDSVDDDGDIYFDEFLEILATGDDENLSSEGLVKFFKDLS